MPICKTGFYKWLKINNLTLFSGSQNSGTIHIIKILIDGMDNSDTINILCATDENYAPYCGIMLTSLFENNRDCHFNVFVFEDGSLTEENVKKYHLLAKKYGNEIVLKTIDESMVKGFPIVEGWVTLPTYYRLLAAELLPEDVDKIIYFDGDILVRDDIKPLWREELNGRAVAGVKDKVDHCVRLGYDASFSYFNAGMLVCNLNFWRLNRIGNLAIDYILVNRDDKVKLLCMDQDALNVVVGEQKKLFPERYNFRVSRLKKERWANYSGKERRKCVDDCKSACVVHFCGVVKPWNYREYGGPFWADWNKMRKKSYWADCLVKPSLYKHIKHLIKRYFFPKYMRNNMREEFAIPSELKSFFRMIG